MTQEQQIDEAKKILRYMIEGCRHVKGESDIHEDAKNLASLMIWDCNKTLAALDGKKLPSL